MTAVPLLYDDLLGAFFVMVSLMPLLSFVALAIHSPPNTPNGFAPLRVSNSAALLARVLPDKRLQPVSAARPVACSSSSAPVVVAPSNGTTKASVFRGPSSSATVTCVRASLASGACAGKARQL
ncbi:hypothetical protein ERJ75_000524800 [Trypanosoma vivax]|nr:hypothetical protein ERJ75_000524800 [Trypanosoma vivax]